RAVTARVIVLEGKARSPGRVKEKTARPMQCECEMIEVDRVLSAGARRSKLAHELKLKIKLTGRRLPQRAHARRVQLSVGRRRGAAVAFMQPKQVGFDRYLRREGSALIKRSPEERVRVLTVELNAVFL